MAPDILRPVDNPFDPEGGIRMVRGSLGRAVVKTSAVKPEHRVIEAPAICFDDQEQLLEAFRRGELGGPIGRRSAQARPVAAAQ